MKNPVHLTNETLNARDAGAGIALGIFGLLGLAFVLGVIDPLLRDPSGLVFNFINAGGHDFR